ncbi:MAG: [protein-PII] uridylyltransferase [Nitrospirota bacterium]|nr:[protein-PII] uridylyltransferase [Nitrospirota bacterium]
MNAGTHGIGPPDAAGIKALLAVEEAGLRNAHFAGTGGGEIVERRTALIDRTLRTLYQRWSSHPDMPILVAVGGYGRGELNPHSDIDLLFLCRRDNDRDLVTSFLYALWDIGMDIGYSVRTVPECVDLARDDAKIRTSLLESRLVAGDTATYSAFSKTMHSEVFFRKPDKFIEEKLSERGSVRLKYGGSLYLREPNIKESAGGLRDFHTARWIAFTSFRTFAFSDLVRDGVITAGQLAVFLRSRNFLWRIRNELHYLSGRKNDHLTFDIQDAAARDFRFRDTGQLIAVERFMKTYFIHARNILDFSRIVTEKALKGPGGSWFQRTRKLGPFSLVGRTLILSGETPSREDPSQLFTAFAIYQERNVRFSDGLKNLILSCRFNDEVRSSAAASKAFLAILDNPTNLADTLVLMRDMRFLGRYLPEFRAIEALARHDYHHTYTVDEHILTAMRNLENVWQGRYAALTTLAEALHEVSKRWVLTLALLLHDLGKAYRGSHEVRGREIAERILERLRIAGPDRERILFLVGNHLVMAVLSQRRELSDGKVVDDFAGSVGDRETLNMLYLLTYADLSAVSPNAWSTWKATLLQDLYLRTRDHLEKAVSRMAPGDRIADISRKLRDAARERFPDQEIDKFLRAMPESYLLSASLSRMVSHLELVERLQTEQPVIVLRHHDDRGYSELTICAYDAYGMFYRTAGTIAAQGLNILRAQVYTARNGIMFDTFQITDENGSIVKDERIWKTTIEELRETLRTGGRPPSTGGTAYPRKLVGHVDPAVEFDNDTSQSFTIIDVSARDRVGLLHSIAKSLYDLNLDIASAKIVTEGIRALDAFYVTDLLREKIIDPARLAKIKSTLVQVLALPG